ncbi:MAG: TonB-dependent receptor [Cytophagales bacterium]|nr:TonB-dependent receptor [Cytophagales bacterium]
MVQTLYATEEPDSVKTIVLNNNIIISAQRHETEVFDRPESIGYLNKALLRSISPMSMPQALSYVPGVWMQKTNHGGGSAFVRGLTGYQTLLMIDGIRMNNSTYRSGPNQYLNTVDPLMISHIEVLRGSGSVQYGSDAIGGTMQLISASPDFSEDGLKFSGMIYGKYWTSDMEKSVRGAVNLGSKKWAFRGGFTYKDLGDITAGGDLGKLVPTGYDEYAVDLKGIYRIGKNHRATGVYQHLKQRDVPLYHKIAPGGYVHYYFNPQQRDLAYARLESFYDRKLLSEVRYTVSYQNSLEIREKQKSGSDSFITEEDVVNTFGANIDVISKIKDRWDASSGIEYYRDHVGSEANSVDLESGAYTELRGLYPDGSIYDNFAIFTLHSFDLNKWKLTAGLRYNLVRLQLEDTTFGNTAISPDAMVGNLGVVYEINHNHHVSAIMNSSFRAPNVNDVSSFGIADFRYEVPAYDLKPETALNKEIGYKMRYEGFSGALHLFHNKLNDLITNVPDKFNGLDSLEGYKVYKRQNVNEAVLYGGEMEMEVKLSDRLITFGNVTYTYGENISKDEPMRRIPPLNGRLGLRTYFNPNFRLSAEWIFAAEQNRLSGGDIADSRIAKGGTPGWNVVNIYGGYDHKAFTLNASIQNIFDEAYRIHGSGVDGIGRSVWVSLMININP